MKYKERKRLAALRDYSQRRREGKLKEQVQKLKEEHSLLKEKLRESEVKPAIDWNVTPYGEQK